MIDNPDALRVTESRTALMGEKKKKEKIGGNGSADYETRVADRKGRGGSDGSGFNMETEETNVGEWILRRIEFRGTNIERDPLNRG